MTATYMIGSETVSTTKPEPGKGQRNIWYPYEEFGNFFMIDENGYWLCAPMRDDGLIEAEQNGSDYTVNAGEVSDRYPKETAAVNRDFGTEFIPNVMDYADMTDEQLEQVREQLAQEHKEVVARIEAEGDDELCELDGVEEHIMNCDMEMLERQLLRISGNATKLGGVRK